jgi:hypothetical protein
MKTRNKTRIVEILLLTFILAFVARATPNLDVIPSIPWAEDQPNDIGLGNTDDKDWGKYARMEFMATHPAAPTPTLKSVRPEKYWSQQPRIYLA